MAAEFKMANVRLNLLSWCDFRFTKPERNNGDYDNESDSNELVKKKKKWFLLYVCNRMKFNNSMNLFPDGKQRKSEPIIRISLTHIRHFNIFLWMGHV